MTSAKRVVIIVQARMGATRLPGKTLLEVMNRPLLAYQYERLKRCKTVDEVVIATSLNAGDQPIVNYCEKHSIPYFRGSETDVLDRYYQTACAFKADVIVRSTADCPFVEPEVVDAVVEYYLETEPAYGYVSNIIPRTFPRGLDVEVFPFKNLKEAALNAHTPAEREHVTPYFYEHTQQYKIGSVIRSPDISSYRWTLDTPEDYELIATVLKEVYPVNPKFNLDTLLQAFEEHPEWRKINAHIEQKPTRIS